MSDTDGADVTLEPIFIAANRREIEFVQDLLDREDIEYSVRPETFTRSTPFGTGPYAGLLFEVIAGQAQYCRRLIADKGLEHGIVPPPEQS
jgi:hypothetical protein